MNNVFGIRLGINRAWPHATAQLENKVQNQVLIVAVDNIGDRKVNGNDASLAVSQIQRSLSNSDTRRACMGTQR